MSYNATKLTLEQLFDLFAAAMMGLRSFSAFEDCKGKNRKQQRQAKKTITIGNFQSEKLLFIEFIFADRLKIQ